MILIKRYEKKKDKVYNFSPPHKSHVKKLKKKEIFFSAKIYLCYKVKLIMKFSNFLCTPLLPSHKLFNQQSKYTFNDKSELETQ